MKSNFIYCLKRAVERSFGLYRPSLRYYMTSYYFDMERKGKLTGEYQHRAGFTDEWVDGRHPKHAEIQ